MRIRNQQGRQPLMSAFESDHAKDMKNPEYAYQFGRNERELEIIKLLEEHIALQVADDIDQDSMDYHDDLCGLCKNFTRLAVAIALIKGEK